MSHPDVQRNEKVVFYIIFRIADGNFSYLSSSNTQGIFLLSNFTTVESMKKEKYVDTDFPKNRFFY